MYFAKALSDERLIAALKSNQVCVIRTDTLYGLICRADSQLAVENVYQLKKRDEQKSPIVLISNLDQLFDQPSAEAILVLDKVWPGPVSVILPSTNAPSWIKRDNNSVAYRLPSDTRLSELITKTGPLIAPSANPEGLQPAMDVQQAATYFGEKVSVYVDGGQVKNDEPSQLIRIDNNGEAQRLR